MHVSNPRTFWNWIFFGVALGVVAVVALTPPLVYLIDGNDEVTRGTFGDMFGVTNALFSGLAFAGLIVTIFMQRTELKLQREEFIRSVDTQAALLAVARSEQRDREAREHRAATLILGAWKRDPNLSGPKDSPMRRFGAVNKGQSVTNLSLPNVQIEGIFKAQIDYREMLPAGEKLNITFSIPDQNDWAPPDGSTFTLGYVDANGDSRQQSYEWRGDPLGFFCTNLGFHESPIDDDTAR